MDRRDYWALCKHIFANAMIKKKEIIHFFNYFSLFYNEVWVDKVEKPQRPTVTKYLATAEPIVQQYPLKNTKKSPQIRYDISVWIATSFIVH